MRRSASGSRVSDQSPSPSPPRSQSATFMEDDVELLLPRYDPSSQPGKREKSRLRSAENVIHFIPLLLLLCVVILWLFSHSDLLRLSSYTNRRYFASFRNKHILLPIFAFIAIPLSALHLSLTLTSFRLKNHVFRLEALANVVHTRFEARQIWEESRQDAVSLLRLKSRYFVPSFILSCIVSIAVITSTSFSHQGLNPSLKSSFASVKSSWMRVTATSIVVYGLLFLYSPVPMFLSAIFGYTPTLRHLITFLSLGIEVYIMAITGLGLVVSVVEERYGFDAVKEGTGLMKGRRITGLALAGVFVFLSSWIGHGMEKLAKELDVDSSSGSWWRSVVLSGGWEGWKLVCMYGAEVVLSYVVVTVFYCECRKRHGNSDPDVADEEGLAI
uniref:Transmembrane protein n=1 Tax=Brassica campestris TaxID=3711 RepID=M4FG74_BRACM